MLLLQLTFNGLLLTMAEWEMWYGMLRLLYFKTNWEVVRIIYMCWHKWESYLFIFLFYHVFTVFSILFIYIFLFSLFFLQLFSIFFFLIFVGFGQTDDDMIFIYINIYINRKKNRRQKKMISIFPSVSTSVNPLIW